MEITEIRVFLKEGPDKKLKAYTAVTFDQVFVVRNVKVIQGSNGLFIAMPSRKMKNSCPKCGFKNETGGRYCGGCAVRLPQRQEDNARGLKNEHRDIAHPVTQEFRRHLESQVLQAYEAEVARNQA